ncbi:MAG: TIGR04283 family arsenosugar biosynthesis glycosyltransferase [Nitrospirae bacterium]|nr:TIGR04283 family arsenosugar biosynthesis glycosyltransferase [Nitrospirota bacterium]
MKISVIVPTINEEKVLRGTLNRLKKSMDLDLIVVDGGSQDETVAIAKEYTRKVFVTPPGRARQMNEGARHAEGEILLFLHADSTIATGGIGKIVPAITSLHAVGGAFQLAFDSRNILMRIVAGLANFRSRFTRIPYGDQGIFITRALFQKLEGFPDLPILEDVAFATRMKKEGRIAILRDKITTSSRRWKKEGIFYTTLRNRLFMIGYQLGVSPRRLASCYRNIR